MPVTILRANQAAFECTDPAVSHINLDYVQRADMTFRRDVGDGWTDELPNRSGDLSLIPANTAVKYDCRGSHEMLFPGLPDASLASLFDESRAGTLSSIYPLVGATIFRDEAIRCTMMQMWAESARSGGASDLLMDGLTQVLLARLLDKAGVLRRPQTIPLLGQAELSRIDALVDHKLSERIIVEDLARALDMPRWTFADAFKATTGETPHAYATTRHIDRACQFLRLGNMPLAEIAYATGFASQSHMTDTFRRVMGTTPGAWRQQVRA